MSSGEPQDKCPDCAGVVVDGWACGRCGWYPADEADDLERELLELAHEPSTDISDGVAVLQSNDAIGPRRGAGKR